jgi:ADP-ribose pyrophosphatase YjhB (NUDIX family)
MVRRANEPGRGQWSLPGGRVEHGEYLAAALEREVKEETAIDVRAGGLVGIFEVLGDSHYVVLDYYAEPQGPAEPRPSADADDARWVHVDEVTELDCTPRFVETMRGWGVLPQGSPP